MNSNAGHLRAGLRHRVGADEARPPTLRRLIIFAANSPRFPSPTTFFVSRGDDAFERHARRQNFQPAQLALVEPAKIGAVPGDQHIGFCLCRSREDGRIFGRKSCQAGPAHFLRARLATDREMRDQLFEVSSFRRMLARNVAARNSHIPVSARRKKARIGLSVPCAALNRMFASRKMRI